MKLVDILVGVDGVGTFLLGLIGAWLASSAINGWRKEGHSAEIDLLLGFGLGLVAHGTTMLLSMVRRQMTMAGQPVWWFVDSWPYFGTKMLAVLAGLLALRGLTASRFGEWPWVLALALVAVGIVWHLPADLLGAWLHSTIESWH